MTDVNSFLLSTGVPSFKFTEKGALAKGHIVSLDMQQQRSIDDGAPLFWDDAKTQPKMQLRIVLATDARDSDNDNGHRAIYVKGQMQQAVRDSIKKAGADKIEEGGLLAVKYVADGEPPKRGMNAPKEYVAQYEAPSITPAAVAVDDLL
jgi:hypothetical protein